MTLPRAVLTLIMLAGLIAFGSGPAARAAGLTLVIGR